MFEPEERHQRLAVCICYKHSIGNQHLPLHPISRTSSTDHFGKRRLTHLSLIFTLPPVRDERTLARLRSQRDRHPTVSHSGDMGETKINGRLEKDRSRQKRSGCSLDIGPSGHSPSLSHWRLEKRPAMACSGYLQIHFQCDSHSNQSYLSRSLSHNTADGLLD